MNFNILMVVMNHFCLFSCSVII